MIENPRKGVKTLT